jgi:nucleotide-binding universal stress UspA family protein
MRVLLAIDGSAAAAAASRLVGSLEWPEGTVIEVVAVVEPLADLFGMSAVAAYDDSIDSDATRSLNALLNETCAALRDAGRIVRPVLLDGRAATAIVDEAVDFRAELIVVGSRGLGPLKAMVMGSVSAEVVDHAPCPVLVVRRPELGSVLLAVDGSPTSEAATTFVRGCGFLADHPIEVIAVAAEAVSVPPAQFAGASDAVFESAERVNATYRDRAKDIAAAATEKLRVDGLHARWSISQGNPAHEIIEAAESLGSDLIVLGSRGHTGLTRLVLGSVARNVLLHTQTSVLIVHEPLRERLPERVRRAERTQVGPLAAGLVG